MLDATGVEVRGPVEGPFVSLVPSLTETLFAVGAGDRVVARTEFCVLPAGDVDLVPTVGGTKNPDVAAIVARRPALVLANVEENTPRAVAALRAAGVPVFVTYPRTVAEGVETVRAIGRLAGGGAEQAASRLADELAAALASARARAAGRPPRRVFCPIWKGPWMAFSADTYAHDLLAACGGANVFAGGPRRYFPVTLDEAAGLAPDVVLLPDEPYAFGPADADEVAAALPGVGARRVRLVSGRHLTWYGPQIGAGVAAIARAIAS